MTELFAVVNGIKICYKIYGEGYPVILIHGYGGTKEEWLAQVDALSTCFKVITFDCRGAGKSDRPNLPYTMDMFADDINGLLDFLETVKGHIIAQSLGGMIAQNFVLKYPERVNKLVLINTWYGFPNEQGLEMYKNSQIAYVKEFKKDPLRTFLKRAKMGYSRGFWKMMAENPKRKFYDLWSVEDIIKKDLANPPTPQDSINAANAIAGHNTLDRLHEIKSKTLVLCGEKDRVSPIMVNKQIHKEVPNSIFRIIKDARHGLMLEKASEVNQILIEFLKD
jgi:pimeloyl-ACP methyl ester carboxylesterase